MSKRIEYCIVFQSITSCLRFICDLLNSKVSCRAFHTMRRSLWHTCTMQHGMQPNVDKRNESPSYSHLLNRNTHTYYYGQKKKQQSHLSVLCFCARKIFVQIFFRSTFQSNFARACSPYQYALKENKSRQFSITSFCNIILFKEMLIVLLQKMCLIFNDK